MSDLRKQLRNEFQDPEYRYAYAQSFLNTKLATQIRILREQRCKTQAEVAQLANTRQAGFSRFEDVNHSVWKTDTLWKIACALGVRLNISFETFGSLIDEKENFTKRALQRPDFTDDPAFSELEAAFSNLVNISEYKDRADTEPQGKQELSAATLAPPRGNRITEGVAHGVSGMPRSQTLDNESGLMPNRIPPVAQGREREAKWKS